MFSPHNGYWLVLNVTLSRCHCHFNRFLQVMTCRNLEAHEKFRTFALSSGGRRCPRKRSPFPGQEPADFRARKQNLNMKH